MIIINDIRTEIPAVIICKRKATGNSHKLEVFTAAERGWFDVRMFFISRKPSLMRFTASSNADVSHDGRSTVKCAPTSEPMTSLSGRQAQSQSKILLTYSHVVDLE